MHPADGWRLCRPDGGRARSLRRDADPERPGVCFDESPTQLIGEARQPIPAEPGQPERYDCEYRRNGTVNLFVYRACRGEAPGVECPSQQPHRGDYPRCWHRCAVRRADGSVGAGRGVGQSGARCHAEAADNHACGPGRTAQDDPYVCPCTVVLQNGFDARNPVRLAVLEYAATRARAAEGPTFPLSADGYRATHRHLFQDVFDPGKRTPGVP